MALASDDQLLLFELFEAPLRNVTAAAAQTAKEDLEARSALIAAGAAQGEHARVLHFCSRCRASIRRYAGRAIARCALRARRSPSSRLAVGTLPVQPSRPSRAQRSSQMTSSSGW